MCGTDLYPDGVSFSAEESLLADERARFIEHDDPGDDSRYLDMPRVNIIPIDRPSTAPNADRIAALEDGFERFERFEVMVAESLTNLHDLGRMQGSDIRHLFERTDRLQGSLAKLALAIVERRGAVRRWFREHVYRGPYLGTDVAVPYEDEPRAR